MLFLVATTSLPAVDRPNADRWNAPRSRQLSKNHIQAQILLWDFSGQGAKNLGWE